MKGATWTPLKPRTLARKFQSTRPVKGATLAEMVAGGKFRFQSTRPVKGATSSRSRHLQADRAFQSTRPVKGATRVGATDAGPSGSFNPRAP